VAARVALDGFDAVIHWLGRCPVNSQRRSRSSSRRTTTRRSRS